MAGTGAAVDELTVATDPDGYGDLVALADRHSGLRAWSVEGTGSYGAGLARFLAERGELVIELDRPNRPARRNGAKSHPGDMRIRAAAAMTLRVARLRNRDRRVSGAETTKASSCR